MIDVHRRSSAFIGVHRRLHLTLRTIAGLALCTAFIGNLSAAEMKKVSGTFSK